MANNPKELGTENVRQLLISYSGPAIAAMMASALYNVIDRAFIGQGVCALAISGLAITMPVMNLSAAFGAMIGAGGATLTSIKLGQQDIGSAQKVLGNVFLLNVVLGIIFMALGLLFLDEILYFFGASENTISYAKDFMQVILIGNVITHLYLGLNSVMRASGHPTKAMRMTFLTVLINLALAPLFIFVFNWGIMGAASATIVAQTVAFVIIMKHFSDKANILHWRRDIFTFDKRIIKGIISIGMAPFMLNACACLVVILINRALKEYGGDLAVGAYGGIVNSVLMVFAMIVMGLNQGMQPIAGYNFGAQIYSRVRKVLKLTILAATAVTTFAFIVSETIPYYVARLFTTDPELIAVAIRGLRICAAAFPIVGFQMVTSNFFQSVGKASKAVVLSSTRQLLLLVPLLLILPAHFKSVESVLVCMPISDALSSIIAFVLLRLEMRKFSRLKDNPIIE
ncbi:MAG: MATE family efflux transporter [Paludibacteraceae bacterium]|nr:MATE family efflux transporter [Paludibacteraceae bacterium]MBP5482122.1 MATE family efflux transporter [Paludibacteraceae bacterium]